MRKLTLTLAGGFCGAITRYTLSAPLLRLASRLPGAHAAFPYDILFINLSGALLLGFLFGLFEHGAPVSPDIRLTIGTGFLGAYTTFSSYMVGTDQLLAHGQILAGILYVMGSMAGGIILAFVGFRLAGAGWKSWRDLAAASVSEELLVDGGWEDTAKRASSGSMTRRSVNASMAADADGERVPR
jgi:CrcB protein